MADLRHDLDRLARNLRWAWHRPTGDLLRALDPAAWLATNRNPVAVVAELSPQRLAALEADPGFRTRVSVALADLDAELHREDTWYARAGGDPQRRVAYLSAEFGLVDCLRIYSGGLGVLAGDHLRSASDLGLPMVAIGLAYDEGYFVQSIDAHGHQHAEPATNRFDQLPTERVRDAEGHPLTFEVELGDGPLLVQAWKVQVGRVPLYLLETGVASNSEAQRRITFELYGGDSDTRIRQEVVLGVGAVKLLHALDLDVQVLHLNEGHAAFAGLERIGDLLAEGLDLDEARARLRDELVFTTHTPVPAGHDEFGYDLAAHHLGPLCHRIGVPFEQLWPLANAPGDHTWNQTVLALRLAGRANGVARLHGEVSRQMWARLWPDRAVEDVPIAHVTNGVHPQQWVGPEIGELLNRHLGDTWRTLASPDTFQALDEVPADQLWAAHRRARHRLVEMARERLDAQATLWGTGPDGNGLDPDALTITFARRFATYKRATLLAHDVDRLADILTGAGRPVQILIAGKAHPQDRYGQAFITRLVELSRDPRLQGRLVFLENYDLAMAAALVAGSDVWLNNPLRPNEASGTSGMKSAMNGGLNLSILDGWWDEAVADLTAASNAGFGWAIEAGSLPEDPGGRDAAEADALYRLLADEVVPTYHDRDAEGVPQRWVAMMREAITLLSPVFSTHRMVADYTRRYGQLPED